MQHPSQAPHLHGCLVLSEHLSSDVGDYLQHPARLLTVATRDFKQHQGGTGGCWVRLASRNPKSAAQEHGADLVFASYLGMD